MTYSLFGNYFKIIFKNKKGQNFFFLKHFINGSFRSLIENFGVYHKLFSSICKNYTIFNSNRPKLVCDIFDKGIAAITTMKWKKMKLKKHKMRKRRKAIRNKTRAILR